MSYLITTFLIFSLRSKFGIESLSSLVEGLFLEKWSPSQNETFFNTSEKLLKNRNWTFPVVPYFTRKLDFAPNSLTKINSNIQNSMVMFDRKYSFRANLVQKIKVDSLTWNLVLRILETCRIQWWCSHFFEIVNTRILVPRLMWIFRVQWCSSFFFYFDRKYLF